MLLPNRGFAFPKIYDFHVLMQRACSVSISNIIVVNSYSKQEPPFWCYLKIIAKDVEVFFNLASGCNTRHEAKPSREVKNDLICILSL